MKKNRFNIIAFLLMLTGAACAQKQITVAKTGRANFRTIQAAINSLTADWQGTNGAAIMLMITEQQRSI